MYCFSHQVAFGREFITAIENKFGQVLLYTLRGTVIVLQSMWVTAMDVSVLTAWRPKGVSKIGTLEC